MGARGLCPGKVSLRAASPELLAVRSSAPHCLRCGLLLLILAVGENSSSERAAGTVFLSIQDKDGGEGEEASSTPSSGRPLPPWAAESSRCSLCAPFPPGPMEVPFGAAPPPPRHQFWQELPGFDFCSDSWLLARPRPQHLCVSLSVCIKFREEESCSDSGLWPVG